VPYQEAASDVLIEQLRSGQPRGDMQALGSGAPYRKARVFRQSRRPTAIDVNGLGWAGVIEEATPGFRYGRLRPSRS
jgi:hypothetical protein